MKKFLKLLSLSLLPVLVVSCGSMQKSIAKQMILNIDLVSTAVPDQHYSDLTHGLNIYTTANITKENMFDVSEASGDVRRIIENATINIDPPVKTFATNALTTYARSMGINVGNSMSDNYNLRVEVKRFQISFRKDKSSVAVVELEYALTDPDNKTLLRQTSRGRFETQAQLNESKKFDRAFSEALQNMQWNDIAGYLRINRRADQEPTKKVQGDGNTALEHSIIRWNIVSTPGGADVYWRVVSSTPDVKNTNASYLGTTPYESTESFDIRGLTYENAGNIQIEIKCERNGYLPQTRRFNLLQVIDQKEISTKFNLVKDEE